MVDLVKATASPCELCSKKAYQLGIRHIYYIDPYPGISRTHILSFGKEDNPEMHLFYGAIGEAYLALYTSRIMFKDELELMTGINCKKEARPNDSEDDWNTRDITYMKYEVLFSFVGRREKINCIRNVTVKANAEGINHIKRKIIWTGGSYDGTKLRDASSGLTIQETADGERAYSYTIGFGEEGIPVGSEKDYSLITEMKDEQHVMQRHVAHMIKHKTEHLKLELKCPKGLVENVRNIRYADLEMKEIFDEEEGNLVSDMEDVETYVWEEDNPNLFYTYSIEWDWKDAQKE